MRKTISLSFNMVAWGALGIQLEVADLSNWSFWLKQKMFIRGANQANFPSTKKDSKSRPPKIFVLFLSLIALSAHKWNCMPKINKGAFLTPYYWEVIIGYIHLSNDNQNKRCDTHIIGNGEFMSTGWGIGIQTWAYARENGYCLKYCTFDDISPK